MKCRLVIGSDFVDLAGASGPSSDTQGLNVGYNVEAEKVNYIGVDEARQYFRAGSQITASFTSSTEYPTVADAEAAMGALYETLKDQAGAVAYIGGITYDGTNQVETATAAGTAQTQVTVTQSTADAIHYTDDGTDPTTGSPTITSGESFIKAGSFRVKALAVKSGQTDSAIISRGFIVTGQVNEASVSPESSAQPAGTVTATVTNQLAGVTMHYTTNGTDPTTGSPTVASGGTVSVPVPGQLRVLSVKAGLTDSPIKEVNFIALPPPSGYSQTTYVDGGITYRVHTMTSYSKVIVNSGGAVDYLIIGAGGAGGGFADSRNGGGGGAGRFTTGPLSVSTNERLTVKVGAGGVSSEISPATAASDGGLSQIRVESIGLNIDSKGGGGGGIGVNQNGRPGGSGSFVGSGGGATATGSGGFGVWRGGDGIATNRSGGGGSSTLQGLTQSSAASDLSPRAGTTSAFNGISTVYCNGGGVLASFSSLTPGSGGAGLRSTSGTGQDGADGIVMIRHVDGAVLLTVFSDVASTPTITPSSTAAATGYVGVSVTMLAGSQYFSIPVLAGETAATWAATARAQLAASAFVTRDYVVSGAGTSIVLTSKKHGADASLNISITNGSPSPGITPAATSANTAPGSPDTLSPVITIFDAIAQVQVTYRGKSLSIQSNISGRTTAP